MLQQVKVVVTKLDSSGSIFNDESKTDSCKMLSGFYIHAMEQICLCVLTAHPINKQIYKCY